MFTNQINPSDAQLAQLKAYPKNKPLVMLNILRFHAKTTTNETGQEVYARYFKNAQPFVAKTGAKLIWKGKVFNTIIGDSENVPHLTFLVEYASVHDFFTLISDPDYQKIAGDRGLALEYGGLLACETIV
jgi:uncharacterized protein (DUF1330 family)